MSMTRFQMRYDACEDRALLYIDTADADRFAMWLPRGACLKLLVRAQEMRALAPLRIAEMERAARHPARVLALAIDPRGQQVEPRQSPLGPTPARVDTVSTFLLHQRVVCTLGQQGGFQLRFALSWEFFNHWMLMVENMDEEADWDLMQALSRLLGDLAPAEAQALHRITGPTVPVRSVMH